MTRNADRVKTRSLSRYARTCSGASPIRSAFFSFYAAFFCSHRFPPVPSIDLPTDHKNNLPSVIKRRRKEQQCTHTSQRQSGLEYITTPSVTAQIQKALTTIRRVQSPYRLVTFLAPPSVSRKTSSRRGWRLKRRLGTRLDRHTLADYRHKLTGNPHNKYQPNPGEHPIA